METKRVGFYRELSYGYKSDPIIKDAIRQSTNYNKKGVINYLQTAPILSVAPGLSRDVIDPSHPIIGTISIRTDGVWEWPEDLAYYIENYNLFLPLAFIQHMVNKRFIPPREDENRIGT